MRSDEWEDGTKTSWSYVYDVPILFPDPRHGVEVRPQELNIAVFGVEVSALRDPSVCIG